MSILSVKLTKTKKMVLVFFLVLLVVGGYFGYKKLTTKTGGAQYVTSAAIKGTLSQTVSTTGQVSGLSQVDIKSQVSGTVKKVAVISGQTVKAGDVIVEIDNQDAYKTVRDAEISLQSAKLSLEKIKSPPDTLSLLQAENSLTQAKQAKQKAEDDLIKAYEDAFNTVADAYLDMPSVISELFNTLYSNSVALSKATLPKEQNITTFNNVLDIEGRKYMLPFANKAEADYKLAREQFDKNFVLYKEVTRNSGRTAIDALLVDTLETTKSMAQAAKSESNFLDAWADYRNTHSQEMFAKVSELQNNLNTYTGQINSHISSLLAITRTIQTTKESIINAEQTVGEKTESLANLKAGSDVLDIKSQELSVEQKQNALQDAREKFADYVIRAPFDGVVGKVSINKSDSVASGGAVATVITNKKIAEVSLNEIDVAKIKVGQKVILTFDAIENTDFTGQVMEVDNIGITSQGVVSYGVKVVFDVQDDRIKSGMSVSANIITNTKQDVVMVPNAAVKSQGQVRYVEILENNLPKKINIETGISSDTETEIVSGLKEGDEVITQTIDVSAQAPKASTGASPLGGGTFRALGR